MEAKKLRDKLRGHIQLELKNSTWIAKVDPKSFEETFGVHVENHVMSKEEGVALFNEVQALHDIPPLQNPEGYMVLDDNVSEYIKHSYRDKYENALEDITLGYVDGTGYGLENVLDRLDSTIRSDSKEFLPDNVRYGDLRFVAMNPERKVAINNYVMERLSATLVYEQRKSYELSSRERGRNDLIAAGSALKLALSDDKQEQLEL